MNAPREFYQFGNFGYATHRGDKEVGNALERSAILHRYETRLQRDGEYSRGRESLSEDSQNIPCAILKRRGSSWVSPYTSI